jgi:hypothetical protein
MLWSQTASRSANGFSATASQGGLSLGLQFLNAIARRDEQVPESREVRCVAERAVPGDDLGAGRHCCRSHQVQRVRSFEMTRTSWHGRFAIMRSWSGLIDRPAVAMRVALRFSGCAQLFEHGFGIATVRVQRENPCVVFDSEFGLAIIHVRFTKTVVCI